MSHFDLEATYDCQTTIRVVGIGGGGCNAVETMIAEGVTGVEFVVMNTDQQALNASGCERRVQIGEKLTHGLGAGANPEIGRKAALEDVGRIGDVVGGAHMVFVTAGMGGGTGTGAAPIVAQAAKEAGALTVAVVTKPFGFEGRRRFRSAEEGLANLAPNVDAILVIPNDKLLEIDAKLSVRDAFRQADGVLCGSVRGITEIIQINGHINVDFADVRTILSAAGSSLMGVGQARGERRAVDAMQAAVCSPFLEETSLRGATRVLVNFVGGSDMTLAEMNQGMLYLQDQIHDEADVIMGHVVLPEPEETLRVTVIATGFRREPLHGSAAASGATAAARTPFQAAIEAPRQRISSAPSSTRRSAEMAASARQSQMPLAAAADVADEFIDIPTFLRKQAL